MCYTRHLGLGKLSVADRWYRRWKKYLLYGNFMHMYIFDLVIVFFRLLSSRELSGQRPILPRFLLRKEWMKNLELHTRILGHLGPIYCVKFDATGRYLFTGADDNLIKVWDAKTCLLRYTFRGHTSFIMDMTICPENTMLASGSMDKTVRYVF